MKKVIRSLVALAVLSGSAAFGADMPGKGFRVYPVQSTIAEEKFQTMIVNEALEKLGYEIEPIKEVAYAVAYQTIAQNTDDKNIHFMAVNWDPLQSKMFENPGGDEKMYRKGKYIANCAQGYLMDKKTADKYGIKYINDLKDPKLAKLFDSNGNGKADLAGCNPGWGCEKVINHQIKAYDLEQTVEHNQGEYSAIIADTIAKYKRGEPILYYTWVPYWVSGVLVPGKDVVWLQVTHSDHPVTKSTKLSNGMDFGFNVNSMRIVANGSVAQKHKAAAKLFEIMKLSVNDVSAQNMLVSQGEKSPKDLQRHVDAWIKANQETFDGWIKTALAAQ